MPTARTRETVTERIALPPPYTLVRLREGGEAFAHALGIAGQSGAGTLVYVGRFDLAEFAVVLEPTEPLRTARRAFYAGMVALADALRAYAPPNKPVTIDWPDAVRVDGGLVGGGRLGWPQSCAEDETPPWLVFGAMGLLDAPERPSLIESTREGPWTGRSADVSVTLDLMVHDLDLALRHATAMWLVAEGTVAERGAPSAVLASPRTAAAFGIGLHLGQLPTGERFVVPA